MQERIELIRASVRPILLVMATVIYAIFGLADVQVRESVLETFRWMVIAGWVWYFPERAIRHIRDK